MDKSVLNTIIIVQHSLISVVGLIGNALVLLVYVKKLQDNQTITFLIVNLAIADLVCCMVLLPLNCYHELFIDHIGSDFLCKFHSFLNIMNVTYSCLLMTLVAFERCFTIVMPFKRIVSKLRAKFIMLVLIMICFVFGIVGGLGVGIRHQAKVVFLVSQNYSNNSLQIYNKETLVWIKTTHCFPNDLLIPLNAMAYVRLIQNLIVVICFVIIFVLYALICVFVSKRRQLKANRELYYKEILYRSKQNTCSNGQKKNDSPRQPFSHKELTIHSQIEEEFNEGTTNTTDSLLSGVTINSTKKNAIPTILFLKNNPKLNPEVNQEDQQDVQLNNNNNNNNPILMANQAQMNRSLWVSNLKTAFMLFVATLIMVVVYTPAILTSLHFISYNPIYWNILYVNNAANPLIYSFLNPNFRKSLMNRFRNFF
jgi:hypothetical protein